MVPLESDNEARGFKAKVVDDVDDYPTQRKIMEFYVKLRLSSILANADKIEKICGVHSVKVCRVDDSGGAICSLDTILEESR